MKKFISIVVILAMLLTTIFSLSGCGNKNDNSENQIEQNKNSQNSNDGPEESKKYSIITDIDAITEKEWESEYNDLGITNRKRVLDRIEFLVGKAEGYHAPTIHGQLSVPRITYTSELIDTDLKENYSITFNKNNWFYPVRIDNDFKAEYSNNVTFCILDSNFDVWTIVFELKKQSIDNIIKAHDEEPENYTKYEYNNFIYYIPKDTKYSAAGFYKINDEYYIRITLPNFEGQLNESDMKQFMRDVTNNISINKLDGEYKGIEINENYEINLGENVYLNLENSYLKQWWVGTTALNLNRNGIKASVKNEKVEWEIYEYPVFNEQELEQSKKAIEETYNTNTHITYKGIDVAVAFINPIGSESLDNAFYGIILTLDDKIYVIGIEMAELGNTKITSADTEKVNKCVEYILENLLVIK